MTRHLTVAALMALLSTPALADSHSAGDAAKGEKDFARCKGCHMIASPEETLVPGGKLGPNLYGVIGRQAGSLDFKYGADTVAAGEAGLIWTEELLAEYLENPKAFLAKVLDKGSAKSNMTYRHRKNPEDVAAYLATFGN
ncbi:c-type cytochrome [Pseudooceanicola sp. C21-150M6]|uniref:c-type cytochrome n=1 Tax=Pseudooceanicola sp. C21-150M6 TaxID=3434355 RepID=UPI003D7F9C92